MGERCYHLDCNSGLAGDMFLGACLDLGMPLEVLSDAVARLGLDGVTLEARPALRHGIAGTRFRVLLDGSPVEGADPEEGAELPDGPARPQRDEGEAGKTVAGSASGHGGHRHWSDIRQRLETSALEPAVRERALELFGRLAEVEAQQHRIAVEEVHFHELGAVDSLVDVVGAAAAIEWLRPERVTCGPVVVGSGTIEIDHGIFPVPAPATAVLLRGAPIVPGPRGELVTPTGALLLAHLVDEYVDGPELVLEAQGWGLGRWELPDRTNGVRLLAGARRADSRAIGGPRVTVLECQVDDLSGEGLGHLLERMLEEGALDAYLTPVQMKKSRPGVLVSVLCRPEQRERLAVLLLAESGSLGCRFSEWGRLEAERESVPVATEYGEVRIKRGRLGGTVSVEAPEFEDCRTLARRHGVAWREVHRAALVAAARARREEGDRVPGRELA